MLDRPKLNIPETIKICAESDVNLIRNYLESANQQHARESRESEELSKRISNEESMESLADDLYTSSEIKELAEQFAIVGLYRIVELYSKNILKRRYKKEDERRKFDKFTIEKMSKMLRKEHIDLSKVNYFEVQDELRELNNAVKHENKVTSELANQYSCWGKKGDELKNLETAFHRLAPDVPKYLRDLAEKIIP